MGVTTQMTANTVKENVQLYDDGAITACELIHSVLALISQDPELDRTYQLWEPIFKEANIIWEFYFPRER